MALSEPLKWSIMTSKIVLLLGNSVDFIDGKCVTMISAVFSIFDLCYVLWCHCVFYCSCCIRMY